MKRLIVTADDAGLTQGVNRGIMRAFRDGIVTSASLLVTGSAFDDAVRLAREVPELDLGLHLALVGECSALGRDLVPTLVDEAGRFPATSREFFTRAVLGRVSWTEVEKEIGAQMARFQDTGLNLSHIDSHQHLHMFPPVFEIVRRLTRNMGKVWLRNPSGAWKKLPGPGGGRWIQRLGLNLNCLWVKQFHDAGEAQMPDGMLGFEAAGHLSRSALARILREIPDGLYELNCHPGQGDAESQKDYGHWGYQWSQELEALTAPETRALLKEAGIELTSFARATK